MFRPIALAWIAACAAPRASNGEPPAPPLVVPVASAPSSGSAIADAEAPRTAAAQPEVSEPREVACRIAGLGWRSDRLRLRAEGPVFARADRVRATLVLPQAAAPSEAVVVMDDGAVLLRAVLSLADAHLYAAKPKPLLGIVTPTASADLGWARSTPGAVVVTVGTSGVLHAPTPFEAEVGCTDLAIVPASYNARASVTKKTGLPKRDVVSRGAPLAAAAAGKPVAELNGDLQVELVETRGGEARILIEEPSFVVSGWVAQKDLAPPALRGLGVGIGVGGERAYGINRLYLMHCPSDLALFVELGAERVKVGAIHAEAGFRAVATEDKNAPFRAIEVPDSRWLLLEKSARLVVEAPALAVCRQDSPGF